MSNEEPWTIKRLLEWTTDYLQQNGSDSARLDAEVLLAEARSCQRIELYTAYDEVPGPEQLAAFRNWIQERANGKPVAYLVGHREFYSLSFEVNQNVLIPRPETELLVTNAIDFLQSESSPGNKVCDVGTGTGCIAIAIAKNVKSATLTAIDQSEEALVVANRNAEKHSVADRIQFLKSDLLNEVAPEDRFDCIVSNPPYVSEAEFESVSKEVKTEPYQALVSGPKGTETIERLIGQAINFLNPAGMLAIELSPMIAEECLQVLKSNSSYEKAELVNDLSKQARVLVGRRK